MNHDPLCPCSDGEPEDCTLISALTDRCISCRCHMIEQRLDEVRADERDKAAQRILDKCNHPRYDGYPPCPHYRAVAAVRGES